MHNFNIAPMGKMTWGLTYFDEHANLYNGYAYGLLKYFMKSYRHDCKITRKIVFTQFKNWFQKVYTELLWSAFFNSLIKSKLLF